MRCADPAWAIDNNASLTRLLSREWDRVETVCRCLAQIRKGKLPDDEMKNRLNRCQEKIAELRSHPVWQQFAGKHALSDIDLEICMFAAAPQFNPQAGWLIHNLQAGINSPAPCGALIAELLFLNTREIPLLRAQLDPNAPLFTHGILKRGTDDFYAPITPTSTFISFLQSQGRTNLVPQIAGATHIHQPGTLDDLVISKSCRMILDEFIHFVRHGRRVQEQWGACVSGGPVALFSGPSGTGKTFAAAVIANELDYPCFRVDLGLLVSKYIGETEKNLSALFEAAGGRKALLLFDEADSLFGKRGEVRDARDRYANMEVSHLLSRMETHQGPCILTTNLRRHLDPAFARRFQMSAEFVRPDADARLKLWKKLLPPKAPVAEEVDLSRLSESLALTGAQIRNIILHAACCAAGGNARIGNRHLARAAYVEMCKEGKEVVLSSLGELKAFIQ
ncbi:MAG: ATP-binding protein [Desulfobacterales bacterium]|nr:ATP-binding protein [Desulfobacterales bacterium]